MQVKDLSVNELRAVIRETVTETLRDFIIQNNQKLATTQKPQATVKQVPNPSSHQQPDSTSIPVKEVARELGLFLE